MTIEKVTLTLPKDLMDTVREMAPPRSYSKFVAEAIRFYTDIKRRQALRARLIAGYQANASADAAMAAEWAPIEDEDWLAHVPPFTEEKESLPDA
jgi:metal-responsive CopG/Arc/MetJ family transcriptional regulator